MRFAYLCLENMILIGSLALGITACSNNETEEEPAATPEVAIAEEVIEEAEADPETFPDIVAIVNGVEIPKTELLERIAGVDQPNVEMVFRSDQNLVDLGSCFPEKVQPRRGRLDQEHPRKVAP